jgi:hypothetical protein
MKPMQMLLRSPACSDCRGHETEAKIPELVDCAGSRTGVPAREEDEEGDEERERLEGRSFIEPTSQMTTERRSRSIVDPRVKNSMTITGVSLDARWMPLKLQEAEGTSGNRTTGVKRERIQFPVS